MTEHGKAQIQALGAGFVGFVVVVGAGALLMMPRGGAVMKAPASNYAPVDVTSTLSAPAHAGKRAGAPVGESAAVAVSPAPLLSEAERAPAPEAAPAPSAAAIASPRPPSSSGGKALVVTRHLDGSSSANSSARATVASAPVKEEARPGKKPFIAPKLDLKPQQAAVASSIHYGVSNRAELMGRAAGPVYNFAGKNGAQGQKMAQTAGGALETVDAAQQQIESSALNDADKAVLGASLGKVRAAVNGEAKP